MLPLGVAAAAERHGQHQQQEARGATGLSCLQRPRALVWSALAALVGCAVLWKDSLAESPLASVYLERQGRSQRALEGEPPAANISPQAYFLAPASTSSAPVSSTVGSSATALQAVPPGIPIEAAAQHLGWTNGTDPQLAASGVLNFTYPGTDGKSPVQPSPPGGTTVQELQWTRGVDPQLEALGVLNYTYRGTDEKSPAEDVATPLGLPVDHGPGPSWLLNEDKLVVDARAEISKGRGAGMLVAVPVFLDHKARNFGDKVNRPRWLRACLAASRARIRRHGHAMVVRWKPTLREVPRVVKKCPKAAAQHLQCLHENEGRTFNWEKELLMLEYLLSPENFSHVLVLDADAALVHPEHDTLATIQRWRTSCGPAAASSSWRTRTGRFQGRGASMGA